jgi:hypothetical protein
LFSGNFTSQERQRVLGQSGDAVFEKHHQSQFINRDLQHVALLQPPQKDLLRVAGSMLRKRGLLAPSDLSDAQKRTIRQHPKAFELRREKRELMEEMRSLAGTIGKAREPFPHLYQRHEQVKKELSQLRKTLANNTRKTARKEYFHTAPVLEVGRKIKQLLGQFDIGQSDADSSEDENWELPTPDYVFPERVRLVENFYGPEAENFDEDKLLAGRIQVTKDMVALSLLCEPNRRGNRTNWDVEDDETEKSEEPLPAKEESLECPTDICIICCGQSQLSSSNPPPHKFPAKRKDSLRRHLIESHLAHAHDGISCTWPACHGILEFTKVTEFFSACCDCMRMTSILSCIISQQNRASLAAILHPWIAQWNLQNLVVGQALILPLLPWVRRWRTSTRACWSPTNPKLQTLYCVAQRDCGFDEIMERC